MMKDILPLAIADVDDTFSCVAGITTDCEWIRPEPIYKTDLSLNSQIDFEHITKFELENNEAGRRMEDRRLLLPRHFTIENEVNHVDKEKIIKRICDISVDAVFDSGRTAAIFKVKVKDIQFGRTFGAGRKIRIIFEDATGKECNFIVVDKKFKEWFLDRYIDETQTIIQSKKSLIFKALQGEHSYFAVTLSGKKGDFPGTYHGCHPLISGIHIMDKNIYHLL